MPRSRTSLTRTDKDRERDARRNRARALSKRLTRAESQVSELRRELRSVHAHTLSTPLGAPSAWHYTAHARDRGMTVGLSGELLSRLNYVASELRLLLDRAWYDAPRPIHDELVIEAARALVSRLAREGLHAVYQDQPERTLIEPDARQPNLLSDAERTVRREMRKRWGQIMKHKEFSPTGRETQG